MHLKIHEAFMAGSCLWPRPGSSIQGNRVQAEELELQQGSELPTWHSKQGDRLRSFDDPSRLGCFERWMCSELGTTSSTSMMRDVSPVPEYPYHIIAFAYCRCRSNCAKKFNAYVTRDHFLIANCDELRVDD